MNGEASIIARYSGVRKVVTLTSGRFARLAIEGIQLLDGGDDGHGRCSSQCGVLSDRTLSVTGVAVSIQ